MKSAFLLLAILCVSSSLASATFCFPRSSRYAVPISALEVGYEFFPFMPKPANTPKKPTSPETPPVTKPETPPVAKPAAAPVSKPVPTPAEQPKMPPTPSFGGSGGASDAAFLALIKSFCAKTSESDFCFTSIKPLVGTITVPQDATGVLKLAMEATKGQTEVAIKAAKKYVADPKTNKLAVEALHDCLDSYDDATYNLDQVDSALKTNDKGTVNSLLSTVGTDYDTCENGFDDFEITSLMKDYDSKLMKLNSICLAIAKAANLMT